MGKHTPGPWVVFSTTDEKPFYAVMPAGRLGDICVEVRSQADASMIAAAPDMYEALKRLTADPDLELLFPVAEAIRAAISKAEGGE